MQFQDKLTIDGTRRTASGFMAVNARVARGGNIQLYRGDEVGKPELDVVKVYRPADEVFADATIRSFAHRPVTLGHPAASVTADTWKSVAKGWTDGEVLREGDCVRVNMLLADAEAIQAVENGTRELSMGYDCTLDWTSGRTPSGEVYDAIQRGIRSNHVAIVPVARGGHELKIGDSAPHKELSQMTDAEVQTMRDSVKTMTVAQAAALPIYAGLRGAMAGGRSAAEHYAMIDGALPNEANADQIRALAARDHYAHEISNRWQEKPVAAGRDGKPATDLVDSESAHALMVADMSNAWQQR